MSSSNSPCAACKLLRRKCTQECVFAPYFPPDQPQKFANVHKVFGASNVAKLLNDLNVAQREEAVNSLVYEAEARLRDPIYGCVGLISILQHRLKQVDQDLNNAKKELANYIGPSAMLPMLQLQHPGFSQPYPNNPTPPAGFPYNMQASMLGLPAGQPPGAAQLVIRDQYHQQILEAQQLAAVAAAREQQEMFRTYEQQPQRSDQLVGQPPGAAQLVIRDQYHQQILEAQQLAAVAAAREQQEMFRTYEQQPQKCDQLADQPPGAAQSVIRDQYHQQILEARQFAAVAAAREQQEMFRTYEQQPQQSDQLVRLNAGFDTAGQVTASGLSQMALGGLAISPSLALGSYDNPYQIHQQPQEHSHHHHYQIQPQDRAHHHHHQIQQQDYSHDYHHQIQPQDHSQHHHQILSQLLFEQQYLAPQQQQQDQPLAQPQVAPQQQHRARSEEGRSVGPSC